MTKADVAAENRMLRAQLVSACGLNATLLDIVVQMKARDERSRLNSGICRAARIVGAAWSFHLLPAKNIINVFCVPADK